MSEFQLEPGVVIAGKYRIDRVLGRGGMGVVAAAYHLQLEQFVALKLMLPQALGNQEAVGRFLREARAAARISSEHVARVFDVGALATGEPYIAMEYLQGSDIAELLSAQGSFAPEEAVGYLLQACEALAEAHVAGIVHRDLKPANLFLVNRVDGQRIIKVLDFGISKMSPTHASALAGSTMTQTSALMGSPLYMSPEQMASSKGVDARSDVWALGVVLYEMLSGTPPFNAATLPQVCAMIMSQAPQPLAQRMPNLPPLLLAAVDRCLQKEPEARFQNVAEFARALLPLANARGLQSVERISRVLGVQPLPANASVPPQTPTLRSSAPVAGTSGTRATTAPWSDTKPPAKSPSRTGLWGALAIPCLLLLGGGLWFSRRSPSASPAAQAPAAPALRTPSAAPVVAIAPLPAPSEPPSTSPSSAVAASAAPPSISPRRTRPPPVAKAAPAAIAKPASAPLAASARDEAGAPPSAIPSAAQVVPSTTSKAPLPPIRSRL